MSRVTSKDHKSPVRVSLTMLPSVVSSSLIFILLLTKTFNVVDAVASSSSSSFYTSNAEGKNSTAFAKGCLRGVTCTPFYLPLCVPTIVIVSNGCDVCLLLLSLSLTVSSIHTRVDTNWCHTRSFHTQHGMQQVRERENASAIKSCFQFLPLLVQPVWPSDE